VGFLIDEGMKKGVQKNLKMKLQRQALSPFGVRGHDRALNSRDASRL